MGTKQTVHFAHVGMSLYLQPGLLLLFSERCCFQRRSASPFSTTISAFAVWASFQKGGQALAKHLNEYRLKSWP